VSLPSDRPGELHGSIAAAAFARSGGHLALLLLSDDGVAYCHQLTNGFDAAQSTHVCVAASSRLELPAAVSGRDLHSFPFPLKLSFLCPFPLSLSLLSPPYDPN